MLLKILVIQNVKRLIYKLLLLKQFRFYTPLKPCGVFYKKCLKALSNKMSSDEMTLLGTRNI
jgi:hypothetical protein